MNRIVMLALTALIIGFTSPITSPRLLKISSAPGCSSLP
jgi:hypothetical protein